MNATPIPEPGALIRHHTVGRIVGTYHDAGNNLYSPDDKRRANQGGAK